MTIKTKFITSEKLLNERAKLHKLVDMFWLNLDYTRDSVYKEIGKALEYTGACHISDLYENDIKKVVIHFQNILEQNKILECNTCSKCTHKDNIGLNVCALTGKPFCCSINDTSVLVRCNNYEKAHT